MDEKIEIIKKWLGTGSINVFGMPFSGKDTVGVHLAEVLGAKFLSSGIIIRAVEEPYFAKEELSNYALILSSVGRWAGEEYDVIEHAQNSGHPIKAAILLNLSEAEVRARWNESKNLQDRGDRIDDRDEKVLDTRINEFLNKTIPVIETYQKRGLIVPVLATGSRDEVFANVIDALVRLAHNEERKVTMLDESRNIANSVGEINIREAAEQTEEAEN